MNIRQRTLYNIKNNNESFSIEVNKQELINNIKACYDCSRIVLTIHKDCKQLIIENNYGEHTQNIYNHTRYNI